MAISAGTERFQPTEAQRDAMESVSSSMAVDAAAGSGKTAVLIRRILTIVGCDPARPGSGDWARLSGVLAITFTEKAAGEIRAKLRAYVPSAERFRLDQAFIGTFHSFCARLLRRFGPSIGLDPSFDLLDENAAELLAQSCARDTLLAMLERKDPAIAGLVEEVGFATAAGALEELMEFRWHAARALSNRAGAEEWEVAALDALRSAFEEASRAYGARLAEMGSLDFQELEIRALELLGKRPVAAACRRQFANILVDEYQDTNDIQTELALALFDPSANRLFIVGDEAQSIYRFRGANVSCFARVREEIAGRSGRAVRLAHNFRSRRSIISFVNSAQQVLAEGLFADPSSPRPMEHTIEDSIGRPSVIELAFPGADDLRIATLREREAQAMAGMIRENADAGLWSFGDVALLFRAMTESGTYEAALQRMLVPCVSAGGSGFLERREVADLLAAVRFACDPKNTAALLALLRSPAGGLSDDELAVMAGPDGRGVPSAAAADGRLSLISELPSMATHMRPSEIMRRVINEAGLERVWSRLDPSGAAIMNMDRLVTIARDLEREMPTTIREFDSFMAKMRSRGARMGDPSPGAETENAVRLMSVHAAKGLEFPVVFLPDLARRPPASRKQWIFARGGAASESGVAFRKRDPKRPFGSRVRTERFDRLAGAEAEEEGRESRRLLYVAMTRAMDTLVLPVHDGVSAKGSWHDWVGSVLAEHGGRKISTTIAAGRCAHAGTDGALSARVIEHSPPALASPRSADSHLSVSALDSYSVCPMQYYLKHVLGLPAAELPGADRGPIEPDVHGSIVHAMLARATNDARELRASAVALCIANGVAPDDRAIEGLVRDAGAAIELAGAASVGTGFREMPFEIEFGGSTISGTIDWLRPAGTGFEVVDFKTGPTDRARAAESARHCEIQMQIYALAAEAVTGARVSATHLVFPSAGVNLRQAMDPARRKAAVKGIEEILAGIGACDYSVPKDPPCGECIYGRNGMCWEKRAKGERSRVKGTAGKRCARRSKK
ncbi:MAG: ATP-dependent helicase [Proteobacteria bacterium]|nr:ATP-dependent helicase [Pseudomonadota bacterium]